MTGFDPLLNGGTLNSRADDVLLTLFPRQPSGDINWMDNICPGFLGGEHRAVEAAGQHDETRNRHVFSHQEN